MRNAIHHGWYKVAFERELRGSVTPVQIGELPLILVKDSTRLRAFDAACPHRGANLGFGGKLHDDVIVCPFHGHRIGLGTESNFDYRIRAYRTLVAGGLIFVLLDDRHENGLTTMLEQLNTTHFFVQGFSIVTRAPAELVIENGFDRGHFQAVHGLNTKPVLRLLPSSNAEMVVCGDFTAAAFDNVWHQDPKGVASTGIGFIARVFSPNVCVSRLQNAAGEYVVISGATPDGNGGTTVRVSVAVPADVNGRPPSESAIRSLLRDSKLAYEQDLVIWDNRVRDAPSRFDEDDDLVITFHKFCKRFLNGHRE
jgi:3-ketosteroid 9alpha-monooxygenase subunit A